MRALSKPVGISAFVAAAVLVLGLALPTYAAATPPVVLVGRDSKIEVPGGGTLREVAHQDLGAGNWTVFAKAQVENGTDNLSTQRPVNCTLRIGATFQRSAFTPVGFYQGSSEMPMLLVVSAHLSSSGHARLMCDAPGSLTGYMLLKWLRMVAMRTTALSVGPSGDPLTTYGNGASKSHAYQVHSTSTTALTSTSTYLTAARLDLPAGNWAITATATLFSTGAGTTQVSCQITTGGDFDKTSTTLYGVNQVEDRRQAVEEVVHTYSSPGAVRFACRPDSTANGARVRDVRVTAVEATVLLNQPMATEATYPTEPATVRPLIEGGWNDGPLAAHDNGVSLADQELQAGDWVVIAKGWVDNATAPYVVGVGCRLSGSANNDWMELELAPSSLHDHVQAFTLIWYGHVASGGLVAFACHPNGDVPNLNVYWVKLTAYRVGTLTNVPLH